tara:strand:+ start:195 stop:410 length:216 start_codon:yes stop_codon:yes gene_type:complete
MRDTTTQQQEGKTMKNDKLDIIASTFEDETQAIFDECISNDIFRKLVINNSTKEIGAIVELLTEYANNNLI